MGIENERKYVLLPENDLEFCVEVESMPGAKVVQITQGYLPGDARIRSIDATSLKVYYDKDQNKLVHAPGEYVFTYKLMTPGGLVEIETDLTERDYSLLRTQASRVIDKKRVKVPHDGLVWEIDFFRDIANNNLYLIMAEVELPEGVDAPDSIPSFIADNLLYEVPRHDTRFLNSNLSFPDVVRNHVRELKDG